METTKAMAIIGFGGAALVSLILTIGCIFYGDSFGAVCAACSTVCALTISILEAIS